MTLPCKKLRNIFSTRTINTWLDSFHFLNVFCFTYLHHIPILHLHKIKPATTTHAKPTCSSSHISHPIHHIAKSNENQEEICLEQITYTYNLNNITHLTRGPKRGHLRCQVVLIGACVKSVAIRLLQCGQRDIRSLMSCWGSFVPWEISGVLQLALWTHGKMTKQYLLKLLTGSFSGH